MLDDAAPLLTLTGPGGVGKTRLALAIGSVVASACLNGVAFVDPTPLFDPGMIESAVSAILDLPVAASRLAERELLLPEMTGPIGAVLAACPAVQALATSRAPFQLHGQQRMPVEPPDLPDDNASLESIAATGAVRLFAARAQVVGLTFRSRLPMPPPALDAVVTSTGCHSPSNWPRPIARHAPQPPCLSR